VRKVLDVALREFRHTVLTKAFLIAAVIFPTVMWGGSIALQAMLHAPTPPLDGKIAVVDPTGHVAEALRSSLEPEVLAAEHEERLAQVRKMLDENVPAGLREQAEDQLESLLEQPKVEVAIETFSDASHLEDLKSGVRDGRYLVAVHFAPEVLSEDPAANHYDLFTGEGLTRKHEEFIEGKIDDAVIAARCAALGLTEEKVRAATQAPRTFASTLTAQGGEVRSNKAADLLTPAAFMLLLWMSTMMTGQYLLMSTIEEKSNRVIEVLLSAVSPLQLLGGKILGQCMVGLLIVGLYGGLGVSVVQQLGYGHLVPADRLAFLVLYFLMAYFMVASTMAAVGSAVNELREAQTLMGPATMIFMVPLITWFFISDNPNSTFATVLSFIPPMTPFTMILRVCSKEHVAMWQMLATTVVGFAGVAAMVWMAARIFRVGVLMYGKPPTPAELLKWMRYS
jgi:ABC-2 type transport system permease protein